MSFRVLDLFAGCGGLSCGLELAGFEVAVANDIAPFAAETHRSNHKSSSFSLGSITDAALRKDLIDRSRDSGVEIVVGGPPCQAYSLAGKRDVDDARGHLHEDYVSVVNSLQPKIFIMENVKGLLSMKHDARTLSPSEAKQLGRVKALEKEQLSLRKQRKQSKNTERVSFSDADAERLEEITEELRKLRGFSDAVRESVPSRIVKSFRDIGYRVEHRLLNAANYGVPQRRERVIFIGSRLDIPIEFPSPTHRDPSESGSLFDNQLPPWRTTRDAIADLEDAPENIPWSHEFTRHKADFIERLRRTPVGGSVYEGFSDAWYRQPPDEPSRTVKENHGGVFVHYSKPRVLTPRELARLQSFPDDFLFSGPKSKILVQIGNAVPPLLGAALGRSVKRMIDSVESGSSKRSMRSVKKNV